MTAEMLAILLEFQPCFTRPGFENFKALIVGWILCPGRHSISRVIQAAGDLVPRKHHSAYYRFLSRGRWCADSLGQHLFRLLLPFLDDEILVVVDDTLCHKSGPHIFGAGMHHDALRSTYARSSATARTLAFAFGHNWVVLAVCVPLPWNSTRRVAIPFLFRLYRQKKRAPASLYRKRTVLADELIALVTSYIPEGSSLSVVGDSEYACRTVVRNLPSTILFVGPVSMDAALYEQPGPYCGRGRRRSKGARLPSPSELIIKRSIPWTKLSLSVYGKKVPVLIKVQDCLWYTVAGSRLVRVVITRDPSGRINDRAYFATSTCLSAAEILIRFAYRWEIEVAFRNTKQTLGIQDPQNGWWRRARGSRPPTKRPGPNPRGRRGERAVNHTLPIGFLAYALVIIWYLRYGNPQQDVARIKNAVPWYRHKAEPSFADMLVAIRKKIWGYRFSQHPSLHRVLRNVDDVLPDWSLAA